MTIYELDNLLKDHQIFKFENPYCLSAIWRTGDFELFDYGAGILKISFICKHPKSPHQGFISISTVDDGGWQASYYGNDLTPEKAQQISQKLYNRFEGVLPSEQKLNDFLVPLGFYGVFTG